jgi:hypothetical protein
MAGDDDGYQVLSARRGNVKEVVGAINLKLDYLIQAFEGQPLKGDDKGLADGRF